MVSGNPPSPNSKPPAASAPDRTAADDFELGPDLEFAQALSLWADGVRSELRFWNKVFGQVSAGENPDNILGRLEKDRPVLPVLAPFVPAGVCRILDVGAGPLTLCGERHDGSDVKVVPVDALAPFYTRIRRQAKIDAPVPTRFAFAEDLSAEFPENTFDITFSINALDHCINPVGAIYEMVLVTKVGGTVFLDTVENEAANHGYFGLHQWNFSKEGDDFVIWSGRGMRSNITQMLKGSANVSAETIDGHILVTIKKIASPVEDLVAFHRARRGLYLKALLHHLAETQLPPPFGGPNVRRRAARALFRLR